MTNYNLAETAITFDPARVCLARPATGLSAIDHFYETRDLAIRLGASNPFDTDARLRSLLLVAVFSSAEAYFRRILSEVLSYCPIAAETAAAQQVPFGALSVLDVSDMGMTIKDTTGFTSSGEITGRTKSLLGVAIDKGSSADAAITLFEKLCHVRHAIVHSSGEVLFNNRRELRIPGRGRVGVTLDDLAFQESIQIVVNAVRAYNNYLANSLMVRWFVSGVVKRKWPSDRKLVTKLMRTFSSQADSMPTESPLEIYRAVRRTIPERR